MPGAAEAAREATERVLERALTTGYTATQRSAGRKAVAPELAGPGGRRFTPRPVKQRGRSGTADSEFNRKHKRTAKGRVGGGEFAHESPEERSSNQQQQKRLKAAGMYNGKIDGIAGPKTTAAVKAFQAKYGLEESGKLDERTRLTLENPPPRTAADLRREDQQRASKTGSGRSSSSSGRRSGKARRSGSQVRLDTKDPAAVKAFQREHGLEVDGVVGPKTRKAMRESGAKAGKERRGGSERRTSTSDRRSGARPARSGGVLREGAGMDRKRGDGGVKQLQTALEDLGYDLGEPGADGKFGPITKRAIEEFQRDFGLNADGVVGRHTRRLLNMISGRAHGKRGKDNAPLSLDEEALSVSQAGRAAAESALLVMEAKDHKPCTQAEREELRARHGKAAEGVSLKRDNGGLFVHTHRTRSKSYPTVAAIPKTVVKFVEATG